MIKYLEKLKEILKENKKILVKKFLITAVTIIILGIVGVSFIYGKAKTNINYTVEQAQEIVLKAVQGEVISVKKNLELDTLSFEYEFKIKDSNNMLIEATVDSKLGVITDVDNYYD